MIRFAVPRSAHVRFAGLCVLVVALMATRRWDAFVTPQFWAEDAVVFFSEAETLGYRSVPALYAGYYNLAPRLVAWAGTAMALAWLPTFYLVAALALTCATAWCVVQAHLDRRPWERLVLAVSPMLVPFSREILGVLTNSQWILCLVMTSAYVAPAPRGLARWSIWVAMLALAMLSGPFALVFLPVAVIVAVMRRERWTSSLLAAQSAAALLTYFSLVAQPRATRAVAVLDGGLPDGVVRVFQSSPIAALSACALVLWLVLCAWQGARHRYVPLVGVAGCGLMVCLATVVAGPAELIAAFPQGAGRYLYVPWICVVWSAIHARTVMPRPALAMLAVTSLVTLASYDLGRSPNYDWPAVARCLEARPFCEVTILPGWDVGLPGRGPKDRPAGRVPRQLSRSTLPPSYCCRSARAGSDCSRRRTGR